ncbi:MAG: SDR family NAD(P)-dependent oxidoreductase, partial [Micrococcaceae bacterium]|nr:SDR family NAD(P)-dependent oxidoreductase [Micrococcaceae bacterium]
MKNESMTPPGTVLITGAAGGLGRAFALGFAARGYTVAAADIDPVGTAETARLVHEAGGTAQGFTVDVTDPASTTALAAAVADFAGGTVAVLINNA